MLLAGFVLDRIAVVGGPLERMELPFDLCISSPFSSRTSAWPSSTLNGGRARHHRAHGQHGVEPVAELAGEALGDEVGREPLLPVGAVACCSSSSSTARCRRRARDCRRRGCATSGCRSSDCGSSPGRSTAGAACGPRTRSQPSTARVFNSSREPITSKSPVSSSTQIGRARPQIALLGDHPVAHVLEPVQLAGLAVDRLRQERHLLDDLHDLVAPRSC